MFDEALRSIAFVLVRFSTFASNALVFGSAAIVALVLRPAFAIAPEQEWSEGRERVAARLEGLIQAALIATAVATAIGLLLQAALVSEADPSGLSYESFDAVLGTTFGRWYALRFPLIAGLLVLLAGRVHRWALAEPRSGPVPGMAWWLSWASLSLLLLSTSTFSGHAAVAEPRAASLVNDVVHLGAGSVWFAGIVVLSFVLPDAWAGRPGGERLSLLAPAVVRFSRVALAAITIVAVTGTLNSLLHVGALDDFVDSGYGRALLAKILLFLPILALGGFNHFFLRRRLAAAAAGRERTSATSLFRRSIAAELAVAVAIFGMTAVLTGQYRTRQEGVAPEVSSGQTP